MSAIAPNERDHHHHDHEHVHADGTRHSHDHSADGHLNLEEADHGHLHEHVHADVLDQHHRAKGWLKLVEPARDHVVFRVSARSGEGLDGWYGWIRKQVRKQGDTAPAARTL